MIRKQNLKQGSVFLLDSKYGYWKMEEIGAYKGEKSFASFIPND